MARQFRSDDTDRWLDRYGNGQDGALVSSGNSAWNVGISGVTGTATLGAFSIIVDDGAQFDPGNLIIIHQTRSNNNDHGKWELNKVLSVVGNTLNLVYALQFAYTNNPVVGGTNQAQVCEIGQYTSIDILLGHTTTPQFWNQDKGGIVVMMANNAIRIAGIFSGDGRGYNGGQVSSPDGFRGEGTAGDNGTTSHNNTGTGGGGSGDGTVGASGGHATAGQPGVGAPGTPGQAGGTGGTADLIVMIFGGAGGGGQYPFPSGQGESSRSGGILVLIAPRITVTGTIPNSGAIPVGSLAARPGGASGGSTLLKGDIINIGTNKLTALGDNPAGTLGGIGRIHIDYGTMLTGTTNPTADIRQDPILIPPKGASFMYNII